MKEVKGIIDHRILLNYRIDPVVMQKNLPNEFKPKIINGFAVGGICQVSLSEMRPKGIPNFFGTKSHNAAHRIAVLTTKGEGVFVTRRDTNSTINAISSGRLFPGVYKKAEFHVSSNNQSYSARIEQDGNLLMSIDSSVTNNINASSIFDSTKEISDFFLGGNIGWSQKVNKEGFDSIELQTLEWSMKPLEVNSEFSAFFMDESKFPKGSVEFDSAMVMQDLEHSWVSREDLCQICT